MKLLLMPTKRIWTFQIKFFVVLGITLSVMLFVFYLPPIIHDYTEASNKGQGLAYEQEDAQRTTDIVTDFVLLGFSSLIFMLGLLVLIESLLFWVPSLTDITVDKNKGKMSWSWKQFMFPERIFSLFDSDARILIRRKRSSLKGLLMREFTMEIHLMMDQSEIKQISDFTGVERVDQRSHSHTVLFKTVELKRLPLQILHIRTILASKVKIPTKTLSNINKPS